MVYFKCFCNFKSRYFILTQKLINKQAIKLETTRSKKGPKPFICRAVNPYWMPVQAIRLPASSKTLPRALFMAGAFHEAHFNKSPN